MTQLKSWFNPKQGPNSIVWHGAPMAARSQATVAQFYFPTGGKSLDEQDKKVMAQLVAHLRSELRRDRVDLRVIGYADHRGNEQANMRLARRRARAVTQQLGQHLGSEPLYSHVRGTSRGERFASKSDDEQRMAFDRRVEVWSSTADTSFDTMPPLDDKPELCRMVERSYREVQQNSRWGAEGDQTGELIVTAINGVLDVARGKHDKPVPGGEMKKKRNYRWIDAAHTVNRVDIKTKITVIDNFGGTTIEWATTVKYHWGPPQRSVTVNAMRDVSGIGRPTKDLSRWTVSRDKAKKNEFYNPPPRFRTPE